MGIRRDGIMMAGKSGLGTSWCLGRRDTAPSDLGVSRARTATGGEHRRVGLTRLEWAFLAFHGSWGLGFLLDADGICVS